jgi:hypothetical protein
MIPPHLTDDERWKSALEEFCKAHAAQVRFDCPHYEPPCNCHVAERAIDKRVDDAESALRAVFAQKLSDAREALQRMEAQLRASTEALTCLWEWATTIACRSDAGNRYIAIAESVIRESRALTGTPASVAAPELDSPSFEPQTLKGFTARGYERTNRNTPEAFVSKSQEKRFAELRADRLRRNGKPESSAEIVKRDAAASTRLADDAPDFALLAKFATGEGGRRTGVLVTEAGRKALGDDLARAGRASRWLDEMTMQMFGDACDIHGNRALVDLSKARPCSCSESACAGPGDGANHQCGGPKEACGVAGCRECGAPDPVTRVMREGSITHADLMTVREKYGALYTAVFPEVPAALKASEEGDALNREYAVKLRAQIERLK